MSTSTSPESQIEEPRHSIRVVAGRTGLTADAIRAWERRYGAVTPGRSDTRRRLYSDADVERLLLLRRAIAAGRRIGDVAAMDDGTLRDLVASDDQARADAVLPEPVAPKAARSSSSHVGACIQAIEALDGPALQGALSDATVTMAPPVMLDEMLMPLLQEVGERWRDGRLRPAHEHFATATLRSFLGNIPVTYAASEDAPAVIITTPAGQLHEMGALGVAVTAGLDGWKPLFLGASLPAEEIALAARERNAKLVALSIVYPPDDVKLPAELRRLRQLLPEGMPVVVGGSGAGAYAAALTEIGAVQVEDFSALRAQLQRFRGYDA